MSPITISLLRRFSLQLSVGGVEVLVSANSREAEVSRLTMRSASIHTHLAPLCVNDNARESFQVTFLEVDDSQNNTLRILEPEEWPLRLEKYDLQRPMHALGSN